MKNYKQDCTRTKLIVHGYFAPGPSKVACSVNIDLWNKYSEKSWGTLVSQDGLHKNPHIFALYSCGTAVSRQICTNLRGGEILVFSTAAIERMTDRRSDDFRALRKGLGYCWSVTAVALPDEGKRLMEKWLAAADKDIQWIMRKNLKNARLARMDAEWVEKWWG